MDGGFIRHIHLTHWTTFQKKAMLIFTKNPIAAI